MEKDGKKKKEEREEREERERIAIKKERRKKEGEKK